MQPREQLLEELLFGRGRVVLAARQRQPGDEDVVGVEAQIDALHHDEAAHQQPRAGEQRERQRDLGDHQSVSQPAAPEASADAFARILQGIHDIAPRRLDRRRQSEDECRQDRGGQAEHQHRYVQADHHFARDVAVRDQLRDPFGAGVGEQTSDRRPTGGQQQTLDEKLANEMHSPGAERPANRHLLLASGCQRQQHVGDVETGDREQQRDRGGERVQRRLERPDDAVDPAHDADGELLGIERRVLLRHAAGDDVDIRRRLFQRDPGLELPLEHEELALERRIPAVQHDRPVEIRARAS